MVFANQGPGSPNLFHSGQARCGRPPGFPSESYIILIMRTSYVTGAHSKLGCDKSPILQKGSNRITARSACWSPAPGSVGRTPRWSNAKVMDDDPGEWARVINTNLTGMFNTTRAAGFWKSGKLHPGSHGSVPPKTPSPQVRYSICPAGPGNLLNPYPSAYPDPRTVRSGSSPPCWVSTLRNRPTCTSTVRVST